MWSVCGFWLPAGDFFYAASFRSSDFWGLYRSAIVNLSMLAHPPQLRHLQVLLYRVMGHSATYIASRRLLLPDGVTMLRYVAYVELFLLLIVHSLVYETCHFVWHIKHQTVSRWEPILFAVITKYPALVWLSFFLLFRRRWTGPLVIDIAVPRKGI